MDLTGNKYGKLTVVGLNRVAKNYNRLWNCVCECGGTNEVWGRNLRTGKTKSCGCLHKLKKGESSCNALYNGYKRSAKKRKIKFNISKKFFKKITKMDCHYCGSKPLNETKYANSTNRYNGEYLYNGIDRKNNEIGYEEYNCLPCCKDCNFAKRELSYDDFISLVKRIYKNMENYYA